MAGEVRVAPWMYELDPGESYIDLPPVQPLNPLSFVRAEDTEDVARASSGGRMPLLAQRREGLDLGAPEGREITPREQALGRFAESLVLPQNVPDALVSLGTGGAPIGRGIRTALTALGLTLGDSDAEGSLLTPRQAQRAFNATDPTSIREGQRMRDNFSTATRMLNETQDVASVLRNPSQYDPLDLNLAFKEAAQRTFPETGWMMTPTGWLYGAAPNRQRWSQGYPMAPFWMSQPPKKLPDFHRDEILYRAEPQLTETMASYFPREGANRNTGAMYLTPFEIPGTDITPSTILMRLDRGPHNTYAWRLGLEQFTNSFYHEVQHNLQHVTGRPNGANSRRVWDLNPQLQDEYKDFANGSEDMARYDMYQAVPGEWEARVAGEMMANGRLPRRTDVNVPEGQVIPSFWRSMPDFRLRRE